MAGSDQTETGFLSGFSVWKQNFVTLILCGDFLSSFMKTSSDLQTIMENMDIKNHWARLQTQAATCGGNREIIGENGFIHRTAESTPTAFGFWLDLQINKCAFLLCAPTKTGSQQEKLIKWWWWLITNEVYNRSTRVHWWIHGIDTSLAVAHKILYFCWFLCRQIS